MDAIPRQPAPTSSPAPAPDEQPFPYLYLLHRFLRFFSLSVATAVEFRTEDTVPQQRRCL